ncbi:hypothetical protein Tco_0890690 [Tanacetum coccineum]|uniref:Uncharacterized protein n=1 Tax=Tanacetum coccineum TaxID=301880 RepID=A0ABQ5C2D0_9ASTR
MGGTRRRDYVIGGGILYSQYFTHTDYALWEVFVNGDAPAIASASAGTKGPIPPKTVEQKLARKNELKAKSTLLAIPDEHLLKFHGIKDTKTLWEAIKARSEGLDKTYDRFQKLISHLEIHGEVISQKDANLKLLRSLPLAWNNIVLIMRNKSDLDTLSMDDLYNNLKVYESNIKGQSSLSLNTQNVAFVSSENTSSTNEVVNTAHEVSTASSQGQTSSSTYVDDVMFSFFANQSNSPQLDNKDLEQIDTDDLEEMDLKWAPRNQGNRNGDAPRRNAPVDTSTTNDLVVQDGIVSHVLCVICVLLTLPVYTDSEPGLEPSREANDDENYKGGNSTEDPTDMPVPQEEDEREPMFIQAHDPNYVPEPIYPEYIPLEDDHEFPAEEQPLPPVDSPTTESPGYITESDPEEDPEEYEDDETEDGPVDYPMDGGDDGDDDDGDSSRDDARDEDEDEEDEEDEEEEEHLAPADSTTVIPADEPVFPPEGTEPVIPPPSTDITIGARITIRPQASISLPPEAEVERLLAMTTPSPSPPISLSPPSAGERLC